MFDISLTDNVYFYLISMLVTTASVLIAVLSFIIVGVGASNLTNSNKRYQMLPDMKTYSTVFLRPRTSGLNFRKNLGVHGTLLPSNKKQRNG